MMMNTLFSRSFRKVDIFELLGQTGENPALTTFTLAITLFGRGGPKNSVLSHVWLDVTVFDKSGYFFQEKGHAKVGFRTVGAHTDATMVGLGGLTFGRNPPTPFSRLSLDINI